MITRRLTRASLLAVTIWLAGCTILMEGHPSWDPNVTDLSNPAVAESLKGVTILFSKGDVFENLRPLYCVDNGGFGIQIPGPDGGLQTGGKILAVIPVGTRFEIQAVKVRAGFMQSGFVLPYFRVAGVKDSWLYVSGFDDRRTIPGGWDEVVDWNREVFRRVARATPDSSSAQETKPGAKNGDVPPVSD